MGAQIFGGVKEGIWEPGVKPGRIRGNSWKGFVRIRIIEATEKYKRALKGPGLGKGDLRRGKEKNLQRLAVSMGSRM